MGSGLGPVISAAGVRTQQSIEDPKCPGILMSCPLSNALFLGLPHLPYFYLAGGGWGHRPKNLLTPLFQDFPAFV